MMARSERMPTPSTKPRWRPRLRLRTFLLLLTLLCVWLGWRVSAVNRIDRAVAAIERAGFVVEYPPVMPPPSPSLAFPKPPPNATPTEIFDSLI